MNVTSPLCILAAALTLPSLASAGDLALTGGLTATTNYLSDGVSLSGGRPALQPSLEVSLNGFYGGAWASTSNDADGNQVALDLSAGYRGQVMQGLDFDLGVTRHLFDKTKDSSAELDGSLDYALTDKWSLSTEVSYDLKEHTFGKTLGASYALTDSWNIYYDVGRPDPASPIVGQGGVTYALNDKVNLDLQYQDLKGSKGLIALSVNYKFGGGDSGGGADSGAGD